MWFQTLFFILTFLYTLSLYQILLSTVSLCKSTYRPLARPTPPPPGDHPPAVECGGPIELYDLASLLVWSPLACPHTLCIIIAHAEYICEVWCHPGRESNQVSPTYMYPDVTPGGGGGKVTEYRSGCMRFNKIFILGLDYHIFFQSVGPFKRLETLHTIDTVQVYWTRISKNCIVGLIVLLCSIVE
jgi:hypothetical protein